MFMSNIIVITLTNSGNGRGGLFPMPSSWRLANWNVSWAPSVTISGLNFAKAVGV